MEVRERTALKARRGAGKGGDTSPAKMHEEFDDKEASSEEGRLEEGRLDEGRLEEGRF